MTLQPLIENAIYHGIKKSSQSSILVLDIKQLSKSILVYVLDTGVGMTADTLVALKEQLLTSEDFEDNHVGLSNVNLRLTLAYGSASKLRFKSSPDHYTCVYFFLPTSQT